MIHINVNIIMLSEIFIQASTIIGRSANPTQTINELLKTLVNVAGLSKTWIVLPREDGKLLIRYSYDLSTSEIKRGIYDLGEGITGHVMETGEIALVPDIRKEPAYLSRAADLDDMDAETIAFLAVPILQEEKPIGVLAVHRVTPEMKLLKNDLVILRVFASLIQLALRVNGLIEEETVRLTAENLRLQSAIQQRSTPTPGIIGQNKLLLEAIDVAKRAALSDAPVLLHGESGTGKERFSRMIHITSTRRDKPFIAINCSAIPESLLESELFGHEKGAFTGAFARKIGKFEAATDGTLFLDEIGDMSFELQAKLLRTLQEGTIQRVGSHTSTPVNVRIIAATHKDLQTAITKNEFRLDLFYRLNVVPITLPPLSDRADDIPMLAYYFLARSNQRYHKNVSLTESAMSELVRYRWPGNIRQLENVIERLVILSDKDQMDTRDINDVLLQETDFSKKPAQNDFRTHVLSARPYQRVDSIDRDRIIETLVHCQGNKTAAANKLGMSTRQLHYRLRKLNIATTA